MNTQLTPSETEELKTLTHLWNCSEITDEQVKRMEELDRKALNHLPQYLSLGAGVQSSTLALMAATGEVGPMPNGAIFADTLAEPASVYKWLDWLEKQLPFPVYRVTKGSLTEDSVKIHKRTRREGVRVQGLIPAFVLKQDGTTGILGRTCTADYKVQQIVRKLRELESVKRGEKNIQLVQWIGISSDEATRMKPSRDAWAAIRWPLIELGMTRHHCLEWMKKRRFPIPPRSACVYCPFNSDAEWRRLRDKEPEEFAKAVIFERDLQKAHAVDDCRKGVPFLHSSAIPLDKVDFSTDEDHGQQMLFQNECEGMCGV